MNPHSFFANPIFIFQLACFGLVIWGITRIMVAIVKTFTAKSIAVYAGTLIVIALIIWK